MTDPTTIGRTIREARLAHGMSLGQLAAAVGRSSSSVRRWERGEVPPAIGIIDELAGVLELDPDELRALRAGEPEASEESAASEDGPPALETSTDGSLDLDRVPVVRPPAVPEAASADRTRVRGVMGDVLAVLRGATESWSGWIRGGLTVVVLIVMAVILVWALAELAQALGEVWDSFDPGGA